MPGEVLPATVEPAPFVSGPHAKLIALYSGGLLHIPEHESRAAP